MKKHLKQPIPLPYKKWFDENNDRLQAKLCNETELFESITPKVKNILKFELLKEQGFICIYCGKRIGKMPDTLSIDHFEPKFCNRALVLVYNNLMGTCKMSEVKSERIQLADVKTTPKTYQSIAKEKGITMERFTGIGKMKVDEDLEAHGITQVKYRDIPLHCDDTKEKHLETIGWQSKPIPESVEVYILNPTKHNCEDYFEYEPDGSIKPNLKLPASEVQKAENTIKVFHLDNFYLRQARTDAYKRANELLEATIASGMNIEDEAILEDIRSTQNGKLDPYCFVTAYAFRKLME